MSKTPTPLGPRTPNRSADADPAAVQRLRARIDGGGTRDKVAFPDPAAAPLGTDDEAAGTPAQPREARLEAGLQGRGGGASGAPAGRAEGRWPRQWPGWPTGALAAVAAAAGLAAALALAWG